MNWSYIAGFFDGEGSVAIDKKGYPRWEVSCCDHEVLYEIRKFLISNGISFSGKKGGIYFSKITDSGKISKRLVVRGKDDVAKILRNTIDEIVIHHKRRFFLT